MTIKIVNPDDIFQDKSYTQLDLDEMIYLRPDLFETDADVSLITNQPTEITKATEDQVILTLYNSKATMKRASEITEYQELDPNSYEYLEYKLAFAHSGVKDLIVRYPKPYSSCCGNPFTHVH